MKEFVLHNIRVQFITDRIVRLEVKYGADFCDENTMFIPDRNIDGNDVDFTVSNNETHTFLNFNGYTLSMSKNGKSLSGLKVTDKDGKTIYTYKKLANTGELPTPENTPEVFALSDTPRIIVPAHGYTYVGEKKNSDYVIQENAQDVYLLLCQKDHKLLRRLFVGLTGRSELVRLSTLGLWDSKYFVYDQNTAKQRILDYEKHGVYLDNMVIDTDWRNAANGMGYDVNEKLFPDMKEFFDFAHSRDIEIMFNDHPEPLKDAENLLTPSEVKYREENLQRLLDMGLDTWWYDRNWRTILKTPVQSLRAETWGMHIFSEITKHYYEKRDGKYHTRPDIMANVDNIANGSYSGAYGNCSQEEAHICDSASHRYSIQWTGDIPSEYDSIGKEVGNVLGCGNNCIPFANPDCGGHTGNPDKPTYIRWMQFGAFAPVFRPHCTNAVTRTREPWAYDEETLNIVNEYIKVRYRLLPVIYKEAFESYLNGYPICRALAFNYVDDKKACNRADEYMIGDNLLIAPVGDFFKSFFIPEKYYVKPVKAQYFNGTKWEGEPIYQTEYTHLNKYWHLEKPHDEVPVFNFSTCFQTTLKFNKNVNLYVESDDGVVVYINGEKVLEDLTLHGTTRFYLKHLKKDVEYDLQIKHFQGEGDAAISMLYAEAKEEFDPQKRSVYLPKGKWLDAFSGKVYEGGKTITKTCPVEQLPLFIRLGALIPLLYNNGNTKNIKWNKLVYDFYPSKETAVSDYLYEDDTKTVAYKYGQYRKSAYAAYYDETENAFVVNFGKAEGSFKSNKKFTAREITLKCHLIDVKNVDKVTINGETVKFAKTRRDKSAFPLNTDKRATDSAAVIVKFKAELDKDYQVKFYL